MSIHFCGDKDAVEVVLRTIVSVNQLSVYGAVADMCDKLASRISGCSASMERPFAKDKPEIMVSLTDLSTTTKPLLTNGQARGNLLREYKRKFANLPDDLRLIRLCSDGFREHCRSRTVFCDPGRCGTGKIGWLHVESTHYLKMTNYPK